MRRKTARKGIALVAVIGVLILLIAVLAVLVKLGLSERRQVVDEERRAAAGWLAESGLELAKTRLDLDAGYQGETWRLSAEERGGKDPGVVQIVVEPAPDRPSRRLVRVWADTPPDGPRRVRQSRIALIDLKTPSPGANP
jgi:hypothetical protein